eukprot:TRINITY_DN2917_c0_g1_i1.p1 TRINITY_DN2917_c0_g1~~TRINITY_DN2917_c0_g1_i1.p1  ORF type:complete len:312 (+),score=95.85 TRINITY_DN2917_c0_g1_i1:41-976(+)
MLGPLRHGVTAGGVAFSTASAGAGRGRAVCIVFAHALGFCRHVWFPVWDRLAAAAECEMRFVALDLTGHGDGKPGTLPWDWGEYGKDVLEAAETVGVRGASPPSVVVGVGHSMGGAAVLAAAAERADVFDRLLLVEPIVLPPPHRRQDDSPLVTKTRRRRAAFESLAAARASYEGRGAFAGWDPAVLDAYLQGGLRCDSSGAAHLKCTPDWEAEMYAAGSAFPIYNALPALAVPADFAAGAASRHLALAAPPLTTAQYVESLCRQLPKACQGRVTVVPEVGHFLPMQAPAAMARMVLHTVASAAAGRSSRL